MLMIWSSRARNRSFDPVVLCFFGRIVPLRCATESWPAAKGNPQTKLQGLEASSSKSLQSQAVSNPKNRLPLNRLDPCSRPTNEVDRGYGKGAPPAAGSTVVLRSPFVAVNVQQKSDDC